MSDVTKEQRKEFRALGYEFSAGVLDLIFWVVIGLWIITAIGSVTWDRWRAIDSTDADWRHRSGFKVYTDHATGCQYLAAAGDLAPRLGADGRQVCGPVVAK